MTARIDIINRALAGVGAKLLQSETASGGPARLLDYEGVVGHILSSYPWTFCTRTRVLTRKADAPNAHWDYLYELPADMKGAPRALFDRSDCRVPFQDWEPVEPRAIATDAVAVWCQYHVDPGPGFWPAYVAHAISVALSARFALTVREDAALHRLLTAEAFGTEGMMGEGGLVGQARAYDAQSRPSRRISIGSNPLIDARRAGGSWRT